MKFPLIQLYTLNRSKPMVELRGIEEKVQWDECDLTGLPPERIGVSMTNMGTIAKGQWDNLPTMFKATDGVEYPIEDIRLLG
jgi:hypothetical protein